MASGSAKTRVSQHATTPKPSAQKLPLQRPLGQKLSAQPVPSPEHFTLLSDEELENRAETIQKKLQDPRIMVRVFQNQKSGEVVAQLAGGLPFSSEVDAAGQVVDLFIGGLIDRKISGLYLDPNVPSLRQALEPPTKAVPTITSIWPLTFGPDEIENGTGATNTAGRYDIDDLVAALNASYKAKPADPDVVKAARHSLVIRANEATAYMIRHDLAMLDAPAPQVQLDVYALQVSGHESDVAERMTEMKARIATAQRIMRNAPEYLSKVLRDHSSEFATLKAIAEQTPLEGYPYQPLPENTALDALRSSVVRQLAIAGFNFEPRRKLSLNEAFILLAVLPAAQQRVIVREWSGIIAAELEAELASPKGVVTPQQWKKLKSQRVSINQTPTAWHPLWHTEQTLVSSDPAFERTVLRGISEFLRSIQLYWDLDTYDAVQSKGRAWAKTLAEAKVYAMPSLMVPADTSQGEAKTQEANEMLVKLQTLRFSRTPEQLAQYTAVVDSFFDVISRSFSNDLQEAVLDPLMENLRTESANAQGSKGVALVGRTRLVVTSGLTSEIKPSLSGAVDSTAPKPIEADDLLSNLLRREPAPSGSGAARAAREGAEGVFGGLTQFQAVLLGAALAKPVEPAYTTVAPGVGILVRPTVMANAASARLQIKASFGVESTGPDITGRTDSFQPTPVNTVKKHEVTTDTIIGASDLFEISSFDIDTRHPRGPGYVPVLGRLPLIGKAFQWRRKDTQLQHNSVILVNAIILPRALDLTRFYASP